MERERRYLKNALAALAQADGTRARLFLERCLGADKAGDPLLDLCRHLLGFQAYADGDLDRGGDHLTAAAALERSAGLGLGSNHAAHQISLLNHLNGDPRRALGYYTDSVKVSRKQGNPDGVALCLKSMAVIALLEGQHELAARYLGKSRDLLAANQRPEHATVQAWLTLLAGEAERV